MMSRGMLLVMSDRCDQCLYGEHAIVSDARRKELLQEITRTDQYFVCHKATIVGRDVACRGDWDQRRCGQLGRIASRIGGPRFIKESELEGAA